MESMGYFEKINKFKYTVKKETAGMLSFLNLMMTRKEDNSL